MKPFESLDLDEFVTLSNEYNDEYIIFTVEAKEQPCICTKCNRYIEPKALKYYDTRPRHAIDVIHNYRKTVIEIKTRRYTCPHCKSVFTETYKSISVDDRITERLRERLGIEALDDPVLKVANRYGVSHDTVSKALRACIAKLDKSRELIAPKVLGIDEVYVTIEHHHRKEPLAVFTDIEAKKIIEITNKNDKETVIGAIKSLRGWEGIKLVTMDMKLDLSEQRPRMPSYGLMRGRPLPCYSKMQYGIRCYQSQNTR